MLVWVLLTPSRRKLSKKCAGGKMEHMQSACMGEHACKPSLLQPAMVMRAVPPRCSTAVHVSRSSLPLSLQHSCALAPLQPASLCFITPCPPAMSFLWCCRQSTQPWRMKVYRGVPGLLLKSPMIRAATCPAWSSGTAAATSTCRRRSISNQQQQQAYMAVVTNFGANATL